MHEEQPKLKVEFLTAPVALTGWPMEVASVSLSKGSATHEYRVGISFAPAEGPTEAKLHLFVTVGDAAFLRDALSEVLSALRARQANAN